MGVLKKLRKNRRAAKKDLKVAKARAVQEVKESAKDLSRRRKLLAKQEKALIKAENKDLKDRRKHERKLAKTEYAKRKAGRFNAKRVNRWIAASRVALPVLLPLIYRGITAAQEAVTSARARRAGVSSEQMAQFSGYGSELKAKIHGLANSLDDVSLPSGYREDIHDRLEELSTAVSNSEFMTAEQRRRTHSAIKSDLDKITAEVHSRIKR